jgi:uncharacterized protein YbjT (DUF2867 family)
MSYQKTILFIGATGVLARPVVRQVAAAGFRVKAVVRNPAQARQLLPQTVTLIQGDLTDVSSIVRAADGVDAVYINLPATTQPNSAFITELHGTQNVLSAIGKGVTVLKLSKIGASENPDFLDISYKYRSEQLIQAAGNPYIIFRSTWFMDSFPYLLTKYGKAVIYLGNQPNPIHWIAAQDLGDMVVNALTNTSAVANTILTIQGPEAMLFREAAQRYIRAFDRRLALVNLPLWAATLPAWFSGEWLFNQQVMAYYNGRREVFEGQQAWTLLGEPQRRIEDFVREHKQERGS